MIQLKYIYIYTHIITAKGAPQVKKKGLEVEENTEILVSRLCGGNIYKEGEDPVLKDDSEYPEWLWTLRVERGTIPFEAYSKDDPRYWKGLKKKNIERNNYLRKYIKRF